MYYFFINQIFLLDIVLLVYLLHFLLFFNNNIIGVIVNKFLAIVTDFFSYDVALLSSTLVSYFTFVVLLICCFGGYFTYSICLCGILEFTFIYALIA